MGRKVDTLKYLPDRGGVVVITVPIALSQTAAHKYIFVLKKAGVPVIGY